MLTFLVRKEIIKNDNRLVVISLSKVDENDLLQALLLICKAESSYCHYLEMIKLRKNKWNDLYIFFTRCDVGKLTCLSAKFQEDLMEPLREIAWRSYSV